jgi:septal ring factor EnvC (AmiA/AmiB activator)
MMKDTKADSSKSGGAMRLFCVALLAVVVVALCICAMGWQRTHASRAQALAEIEAKSELLNDAMVDIRKGDEALAQLRQTIETKEHALQEAVDHAANVALQRDHLQIELSAMSRRIETAGQAQADAEAIAAQARLDLLEANAAPARLTTEIERLTRNVTSLQEQLADAKGRLAQGPGAAFYAGRSIDTKVVALQLDGSAASITEATRLYAASGERLAFAGRPLRMESDVLLVEVMSWHIQASALVNGQKLFILRAIDHEKAI